jgi:predicted enzyme related to lactoylglutathione lyase
MASPAGSFIWYELMTDDVESAARFYEKVVGWKVSGGVAKSASGQDYRMIGRDDGGYVGGMLPISTDMVAHGAQPTWLGYLYTSDVDRTAAAITADGGAVHMGPVDIAVGRIAMVSDPTGAPFYIMKPNPPRNQKDAASDVFDRKAVQRVCWNELSTSDLERAKSFYAKHFGFTFEREMDLGKRGPYCFIEHAGQELGAMMRRPESGASRWSFALRTKGTIGAARQAVKASGGKVIVPPHEVPGGDYIVICDDPQGVRVIFIGTPDN